MTLPTMNKPSTNKVFSPLQQSLITWLLVILTGWLTLMALEYIGELVSLLVTAALIAFLLNYPVVRVSKILPRSIAAALVYLIVGIIILIIGLTVVPPVLNQGRQLATKLPELFESGRQQLTEFQLWSADRNLPFDVQILQQQFVSKLQEQVQAIASTSLGLVVNTFNWVVNLIVLLVISFYMLLDGEGIWHGLTAFFAPEIRYVLTDTLQRNLQRFISGQILLGIFMATTLSLSFFWLQVPYFLFLAVLIGLLETIPFIGATLGIGIVFLVVVFIDWWLAVEVLSVAVVIQQIKDNIIAPRIMGSLTGFSPVIIFTALLLGAKIAGLLGVVLAIPLTGVIKSIVEIVLDPNLPPQTGSFFNNPLAESTIETMENNQEN